MRDVTKAELDEYFGFAWRDLKPQSFSQEQAQLIGESVTQSRLPAAVLKKAVEAMKAGLRPEDFILSFWISAFQMGREFESRLLTSALRSRVK
jgi:hypothetical protein